MKTWVCIGYPDEENVHFQYATEEERWECKANSRAEAEAKAAEHWRGVFHEILVCEKISKK